MQELPVTAANGEFNSSQRSRLSLNYQAFDREIRQITGETSFIKYLVKSFK